MAATSARDLIEHWAWAGQKGLMNASTARALATACRGVLEVQENWQSLDVSTLDLEESFNIFKNLRAKDFTPDSLRTYESRFRRAVMSYRRYLNEPSTWRFETRITAGNRSSHSDRPRRIQRKRFPDLDGAAKEEHSNIAADGAASVNELQEYLYPIRADVLARLSIPRDANTTELNRLVAWVRTLATDYEPPSA